MLEKTNSEHQFPFLFKKDTNIPKNTPDNVVKAVVKRQLEATEMDFPPTKISKEINFARVLSHDKKDWMKNLKLNGLLLEFAPAELKKDKKIIERALISNNQAFRYVSPELKKDEDYLLELFAEFPAVIKYIDKNLRESPEFIRKAVKANPGVFIYVDERFRDNEDIVMTAICNLNDSDSDLAVFKLASERLRKDKAFVIAIVSVDPMSLEFASQELRNDEEVVNAAVKEESGAINFASEELRQKYYVAVAEELFRT